MLKLFKRFPKIKKNLIILQKKSLKNVKMNAKMSKKKLLKK